MADEQKQQPEKKNMFNVIMEWSLARKLSLIGVALVSLLLFGAIILQSRVADYSLLFANLPGRDASKVVEWLKDRKIPYRLEDGGKDIMVPADQVYEARIELAGVGLAEGGVGFEIFDRQSFGLTDFAQKVNYRRALQGELMRTISSLSPVETARVHLALPEKRLFRDQQKQASASVIVRLHEGRRLTDSQLQGVVYLVAGSVEELEAEKVTVVDATGKILSRGESDKLNGPMTPGMLEYQQAVERRFERRAQSMLDRALGAGNSMVRVTAELNFDQRERIERAVDPNGAVVISEQTSNEKGSTESAAGIPGVASNLQATPPSAVTSTPSSQSQETVNYEMSRVTSKLVESVGSLKNLSVSVLVAEKIVPGAEGAEPQPLPRDAGELQEIEKMVRSALGLNDGRGDVLSVVSMPFETEFLDEPLPAPSPINQIYPYMPLIKYALLAIAALMAYLLFLRPLLRTMRGASAESGPMKTVQELEAELQSGQPMLGGPNDPLAQIRHEVLGGDMAPVQIVKTWLREEAR